MASTQRGAETSRRRTLELMGMERRRAGFRLPWSTDGEESDEAQAVTSEAPADADTATGDTAMPDAAAAEPSSADVVSSATEAAVSEPMTSDQPAAATEPATPEPVEPAIAATPTDDAAAPSTADATAPEATPVDEPDDFLKNLVGAMRGVAETSRDASLAELRTAIDDRIETLRSEASERETDIRRQADTDLEAVGEWERTEIDRVKGEAETKRTDRRAELERQLTAHRASSDQAMESARNRLAQHENELAAFFAQLSEITDPAAFVAAAKRMPRAPELEGTGIAEAAPPTPTDGVDPRLSALGVTLEQAPATEASSGEPTSPTAEEPAETPSETPSATNGTTPAPDAQLAERLAQLDERLSNAQAAAPATAAPAATGTETSTAIVVKGLGSFGAITSFKQSLERVEGVRGVTLSLGPTGEFVYRASHAGEFDLVAAIQGLEGPAASIENTDGTLVVTLSRAR
jgi:hypothetical protein